MHQLTEAFVFSSIRDQARKDEGNFVHLIGSFALIFTSPASLIANIFAVFFLRSSILLPKVVVTVRSRALGGAGMRGLNFHFSRNADDDRQNYAALALP